MQLLQNSPGITAPQVGEHMGISNGSAQVMLTQACTRLGAQRAQIGGPLYRYFTNAEALNAWTQHRLVVVSAHIVGMRRQLAGDSVPPAAEVKPPKPARAPAAPPAITAQAWAAQEAVITPNTKITVYRRPMPSGERVDLMAADLPTVPGWGSKTPHIRDGAFDFKRHQAHPTGGAL